MGNRNKQDGIKTWYQLVNHLDTDGKRNARIKKIGKVITTAFYQIT
jgi:hypothetical protein